MSEDLTQSYKEVEETGTSSKGNYEGSTGGKHGKYELTARVESQLRGNLERIRAKLAREMKDEGFNSKYRHNQFLFPLLFRDEVWEKNRIRASRDIHDEMKLDIQLLGEAYRVFPTKEQDGDFIRIFDEYTEVDGDGLDSPRVEVTSFFIREQPEILERIERVQEAKNS